MDFWSGLNIVATIISAICTAIAVYNALKSKGYYEKSRDLIKYKDINTANLECDSIKDIFRKLPTLANEEISRGKNVDIEVADCGDRIKASINEIRKSMYDKEYNDVIELLDSENKELMRYVDSLISGGVVNNNKFIVNDEFYMCQSKIDKLQELIKRRFDIVSEKLK